MTQVEIALQDGMHFHATGEDGIAISLDSSPQHGGNGLGLRPMELMLAALGGCAAMDVVSILRKKRLRVTDYQVEVRGEQTDRYPAVFTQIWIRHIVTGIDIPESAVQRAIELSEGKYCPAYAMLSQVVPISSSYEILSAPAD